MTHLSDDLLNEYLDNALTTEARAAAESHLAVCEPCVARLAGLRALFADLETLPDLPLAVDFAPLILARLEQTAPLPRPIRWLTFAQAFVAILASILAWPLVATFFQPVALPSLNKTLAAMAQWPGLSLPVFRLPNLAFALPGLDLPSTTLTLAIIGVSLLWLATNGLLLIPRSRRTS